MEGAAMVQSRIRPAALLDERSALNDHLSLEAGDSALYALTDFEREYPITVEADRPIDDALSDMKRLGVRALLVTRQHLDGEDQQVIGLITLFDIERKGRRTLPGVFGKSGRIVRVAEAMTAWEELALVNYASLKTLTAYGLYEMFQGTGLTHLLVVEADGESVLARGLLSRATLAKRLQRCILAPSRSP